MRIVGVHSFVQVVLEDHDCLPGNDRTQPPERAYMQAWSANMTVALSPLMDPTNMRSGAFNPACYIHTSFGLTSPLINGTNYQVRARGCCGCLRGVLRDPTVTPSDHCSLHVQQALGDWYFGRGNASQWKMRDNCGVECNPTCP